MRRSLAGLLAVLCGFEVAAAFLVGGAGLSGVPGWELAVVLTALAVLAFEILRGRRRAATEVD